MADFTYDQHGRRTLLTRGNGVTTDYDYDAASRLDELVQNLAGTSDDRTLSFSHNPAGQITSRTDSNTGYAWTDFVNFDEATSYNGLNQLLSVTAQSTAPLYDGRGNMTRDHQGQTYEYDHYNRLSGVGTSIDLAYDPAGRLQETSGTGITFREMQYDGLDLIAEYDGSGTLTARYVHGPGADEPLVQYAGASVSTRQWLLADERGSIVAVTDWSGAAIQINSYDEYGAPAPGNAGRFGYTGQVWLPETGLYHYKNRAYHPELGRFMQTDPIGVNGGMNLYAYVGGDPVNLVDPLGLRWVESHEWVCGNPKAGLIVCKKVISTVWIDDDAFLYPDNVLSKAGPPTCANPYCDGRPVGTRNDGRCDECGRRFDRGDNQNGRNIHDNATEEEAENDRRNGRKTTSRYWATIRGMLNSGLVIVMMDPVVLMNQCMYQTDDGTAFGEAAEGRSCEA